MSGLITKIREKANHYDRTVIAVGSIVLSLLTIWLTVGDKIDNVISKTPTIIGIKRDISENKAVQAVIDKNINEKLDTIILLMRKR